MFCGTPSYMSPEVVLKQEYEGLPSDIWSCGVLLYTMLCGTFPFKGSGDRDLYKRITKGTYYVPDFVSEDAKRLLSKMLVLEPSKRATARELLVDKWLNTA